MYYKNGLASRRAFLATTALTASLWTTKGLFAEELSRTPSQTEGPFYPDKLPLDTDNDLLVINDGITPAVGEITHLTGKLVDTSGNPLRNAVIEIWQVDAKGAYLHAGSSNREKRDANFQGFGRFMTGSTGEYYFRTVKPVAYPGRTPHIHVAVKRAGQETFTTQCYIKGDPQNERDGVLRGIRDPKLRDLLMADFQPMKESRIGELTANFDIILGATPKDK